MTQIQTINIPLSKLVHNEGQIEGLPRNPRIVKDVKFEKMKLSIEENPEMLQLREILVFKHKDKYVVICGNARLKALRELGYKEATCKIIPDTATPEQLQAYSIKDNNNFGDWDFDLLANEWDSSKLEDWGLDVWPDGGGEDDGVPIDSDLGTSSACNYLKFGGFKIPITDQEEADLAAICEQYTQENGTNLGFANQIVERWKK